MKKFLTVCVAFIVLSALTVSAFPLNCLPGTTIGQLAGFLFARRSTSPYPAEPQAVLLSWNTFGNLGTETTEPSTSNDANLTAANLTLGAGVTADANGNRFGGSNWSDSGDTSPTTLAESVAGNDYIEFTVTPNSGFNFTPTSLVFSWDHSATGPTAVTLRSSTDGFAANLGSVTGMPASLSTGNTINISGLNNRTSATTFRLYGYGSTGQGGSGGFDTATNASNVVLNGTTAGNPTNPSGTGNANPSSVPIGNTTVLTGTVTPGANPTSTSLMVFGDLTSIGGSATQQFFDDGISGGDITAGDNVFTYTAVVSSSTSAGAKSLPVTITDAQARQGNTSISLTVVDTVAPGITYTPLASTTSTAAVALTVAVTDNGPISSVSVFYAVNGGSFSSSACSSGGGGSYNCSIPGNSSGSAVAYYARATDTGANTTTNTSASIPNLYTVNAATVPPGPYATAGVYNNSSLGGNVTVHTNLILGGIITNGANTLTLGCTATVSGAGGASYVIGNLAKQYCVTGSFTFPTGTNPNGVGQPNEEAPEGVPTEYSPVVINVKALNTNPSTLTVSTTDAFMLGMSTTRSLSRFWTVTETGDVQADMTFQYLAEDVNGDETFYNVFRESGGAASQQPGSVNAGANTFTADNVINFSNWGAGVLAPTAADVSIAGRVMTADGNGITRARITVTGNSLFEPREALTGGFGYYTITGLTAGETYVVTVGAKRFRFQAPSRVITLDDNATGLDFVAEP